MFINMCTFDTNCVRKMLPEVLKNSKDGLPITSVPIHDIDFDFTSFFSFDTVIFSTFLCKEECNSLDTIFHPISEFKNYIPYGSNFKKFNYTKFELLPEKEFYETKSYDSSIKFSVREDGEMSFQLSVPKLYYGTNLFLFYDLEKFFKDFHKLLSYYLPDLQSWRKWIIKRIDFCVNFYVGNQIDDLLTYLSKCEFKGRKSLRKSGKEYPYWNWQGRTLKFYDKYKEMEKNKEHHDMSYIDVAKDVLRLEEEWKQKYLKYKLGVEKVSDCTISKFLDYLKGFNFPEKLESIFRNILFKQKEDIDLTVPAVSKRIRDFYKSNNVRGWRTFADNTIQFYNQALFSTRDELYQKYGRGIVYRREKFFRDIGIPLRWDTGRNIKDYLFDYSLFSFDKICYFKEQFN